MLGVGGNSGPDLDIERVQATRIHSQQDLAGLRFRTSDFGQLKLPIVLMQRHRLHGHFRLQ
jgi:hypothetical protein